MGSRRLGCRCFAGAAEQGELVVNATNGAGSLEALRAAGEANLDGKVLIDIPNPPDLSQGIPPFLLVSNTDSLGEQIQACAPPGEGREGAKHDERVREGPIPRSSLPASTRSS